jgi:two-component system, LuxR family, response regulator FixJ
MSPVSPLIHIVDDDAAVREALGLLVGTVGLRVAQWPHPQEFLDRFEREAVGAIVLDMRMPGLSGLTVLDRLRAAGVDQPVIVLTGHGTVEMCRRAFKSGAAEFLEKPVDDELLLEAAHNAVRAHVLSRQRDAAGREAREREVLALVAAGLTNKEIGRALAVSPRTVETHRAHLSDKLQVASLAQLIRQYATLVDAAAPP